GTMRLPIINNDQNKIDEQKSINIIRYAIDHGVNYIDTAYPYHGGNSELVVGKALLDGYRERVVLATKNPVWLARKYDDFEKYLDEQLEKLQTEYFDVYVLHALDKNRWNKIKNLGVLKFLDEAKAKGKIKLAGFSFHDEYDVFEEIIDSYTWDICMIQLNYIDQNDQAGLKGLKYAERKDVPLVIMEPLKGGLLANPPEDILLKFQEVRGISPVEWSFKWISNYSSIKVILSGMSTMDQLIENIEISDQLIINNMTKEDYKVIDEVIDLYCSREIIDCTNCQYCMPCPVGVNIPFNFKLFNEATIYGDLRNSAYKYNLSIKPEEQASNCIECHECESKCPQKINIVQELNRVEKMLRTDKKFESVHWNY
ncbi:MAG: aldo/keto reductase, partial [Clostridiales bacterium]|nr:aldo/keto reductase [Clostridiales bacterium]